MRIAIVTNIPAPYRPSLFAALSERPECDLTVYYCAAAEANREWDIDFGAGYRYELMNGFTLGTTGHVNPRIIRELWQGQFDVAVIHGYAFPTALMALWLGHPRTKRIMWLDGAVPLQTGIRGRLRQGAIHRATSYMVTCEQAVKSLVAVGVNEDRVAVVPLTVDVDRWRRNINEARPSRASDRQRWGIATTAPVIFFCGRFVPSKGLDILVGAIKQLIPAYGAHFILVGDGPLRQDLMDDIAECGLADNVHFPGFVPPDAIAPFYVMSDVFVLPSRREAWGAVVNEALIAGLPTVVTDACGARDLIQPGRNGFVVPAESVDALTDKLALLCRNAQLRSEMAIMAEHTGLSLSPTWAAEKMERALRSTCGEAKLPSAGMVDRHG